MVIQYDNPEFHKNEYSVKKGNVRSDIKKLSNTVYETIFI